MGFMVWSTTEKSDILRQIHHFESAFIIYNWPSAKQIISPHIALITRFFVLWSTFPEYFNKIR